MKLLLDANGNVVVRNGKPVYVHEDGKEVEFDAPGTVATIARLNSEARGHREAKEAAEAALKPFKDAGIEDPVAAKKALDTVKNLDDKKLVDAGKVEEVRAAAVRAYEEKLVEANKAHATQITDLNAKLEKATSDLYSEKIGGSFTRSKFIAEKFAIPADLVQARFGQSFKVEDGKIVAYDSAGNKIFSRTRPGDLADFDEALETLVDAYPYKDSILKGSGASGSGASGSRQSAGGGKTMTRAQFFNLDPATQAAVVKDTTITD